MNLFPRKVITDDTSFFEYYRICRNNVIYATQNYSKKFKLDSSVIKYNYMGVEQVGIIQNIVKVCNCLETACYNRENCKVYVIVSSLYSSKAFFNNIFNSFIPNFYSYTQSKDELHAVEVNDILCVCFHIQLDHINYVIEHPNFEEIE